MMKWHDVSDSDVCCRCHLEHSEEAARSAWVSARLHELQHQLVSFVVVNVVLFCRERHPAFGDVKRVVMEEFVRQR